VCDHCTVQVGEQPKNCPHNCAAAIAAHYGAAYPKLGHQYECPGCARTSDGVAHWVQVPFPSYQDKPTEERLRLEAADRRTFQNALRANVEVMHVLTQGVQRIDPAPPTVTLGVPPPAPTPPPAAPLEAVADATEAATRELQDAGVIPPADPDRLDPRMHAVRSPVSLNDLVDLANVIREKFSKELGAGSEEFALKAFEHVLYLRAQESVAQAALAPLRAVLGGHDFADLIRSAEDPSARELNRLTLAEARDHRRQVHGVVDLDDPAVEAQFTLAARRILEAGSSGPDSYVPPDPVLQELDAPTPAEPAPPIDAGSRPTSETDSTPAVPPGALGLPTPDPPSPLEAEISQLESEVLGLMSRLEEKRRAQEAVRRPNPSSP
jgi:hypothetical protein